MNLWSQDQKCDYQSKENYAQDDSDPEQSSLNTTTSSIDTSRIRSGKTTQPCALALQNYAQNEQDRDYNQRDI